MRIKGENGVGRFAVEFEVANHADMVAARQGQLKPEKVRRVKIRGVVDSGAAELVLPKAVVQQLGLPVGDKVKVRYAARRTATRDCAEEVYVELEGRHGIFMAIVEPKRESALIGAIVLETCDLLVDNKNQRLVPRDPRFRISEIE